MFATGTIELLGASWRWRWRSRARGRTTGASVRRGALLSELSSFVGRQRELAEIRRVLGQTRLLTLTGVGGVGKSRLALRTARHGERGFPDGVSMVELAALTEPGLVPVAVARALGLLDERATDLVEQVADQVGDGRVLLCLDNCEHLLAASAGLVAQLLRSCPALVVLATSREPLGLEGEAVYQVPPLGLPDGPAAEAGGFGSSEAVALFLERAQASLPGFQLTPPNRDAVARICRSLDGIPLAIEFAAVRLRALSVEQIADRLEHQLDLPSTPDRSRPPRQQTLRATMTWSYDLLAEPERILWRRLSVLAGGFTLEAAEEVCVDDLLPAPGVVDALVGLVERSIVGRVTTDGQPRYRLLETVRQYGQERLRAAGEEEPCLRRHRAWCAGLTRAAAERWWGPAQREVLERLEAEHENLGAALAHCLRDADEAEAGLEICADSWFFWNAQRHLGEGRRWLTELLGRAPAPTPARAASLTALGTLLLLQSDATAAEARLQEALELARRLGERTTVTLALARKGSVAAARMDLPRARALTGESLGLARELDSPETLATVLSLAARVALGLRDTEAAIGMYRECVALCRQAGERWLHQRALLPLAIALSDQGHHAEAERMVRDAVVMARDLGDDRMLVWGVEGLAWSRAAEGRAQEAARLLGASEVLRASEPMSSYALDRARTERCRSAAMAALGETRFRQAWGQGAGLDRAEALALALGEPLARSGRSRASGRPLLSEREEEIAALVADGLSNRAIAERLFISVRTAENHVSHILVKLGLGSRAQLVKWVTERGR